MRVFALGCLLLACASEDNAATAGAGGATATVAASTTASSTAQGSGGGSTGVYEGFGSQTPGGARGMPCVVSSLGDAGAGTLRDCVSASNRNVTFSVGGTIELASSIRIEGLDHITIDGSTAPAPGISVTAGPAGVVNALFIVTDASHDIIVTHLRFRDSTDIETGDTFRLYAGSHDIVIDHCSFRRGADGGLDITQDVHDVTVQFSIIAETVKNQLISYNVSNLSLHHNLYALGSERNPQLDTSTNVDIVNNVIYGWGGNYGTRIRDGSSANLVKNIYKPGPTSDPADAVIIEAAQVFSEGNVIPNTADATGNLPSRLAAPPVTELEPNEALALVLAEAGALPRDSEDQAYVDEVAAAP